MAGLLLAVARGTVWTMPQVRQVIPEDAVKAAAKAFIEHGTLLPALEAAAPHMLAEAWEEGHAKALDVAAWAIGNRPESERPETDNPYRSQL